MILVSVLEFVLTIAWSISMKTAIVITGQTRSAAENAPSIIEHLIDRFDADVIINTWTPKDLLDREGRPTNITWLDRVVELYNPTIMLTEDFDQSNMISIIKNNLPTNKTAYDGSWAEETNIENVFYMWYKIWQASMQKRLFETTTKVKYDRIIRLRFDLTFDEFPDIVPKHNEIYIPEGFDHRGGVNDLLAVTTGQSFDTLANIYQGLFHYAKHSEIGFHPESIYRRFLESSKLSIKRFKLSYKLKGVYV